MGKNRNKKGGNNNSYANNPKTNDKSSVGTDENNSNQNITEISNTQESRQVLDTQDNTQECQDKDESSARSEMRKTFLQRIGLCLAKTLFNAIKKEKDELKTELDLLKRAKLECDIQLEDFRSKNENQKIEIETCKEEKDALQTQLSSKDSELKELNELRNELDRQLTEHKNKIISLTSSINSKDKEIIVLKSTNRSAEATKDDTERNLFNKLRNQFSSIITKDMTTDEALNIIYNKIESLKSDVTNAESEKKTAIQNENDIRSSFEEAKRLKLETEERVKQIESSDVGQLVQQVADLEKKSKSQGGEIETLKADKIKAEEEIARLSNDKETLETQLEDSKKENVAIENKHKEDIAILKQEHQAEISKLRNENRDKLNKMKGEHEEAVLKLKEKHKEEEDTLKKQKEEEKERLVSDHKEEINKIEAAHKEESSKMQADFKNKEDKLNVEIKSKDESIQSLRDRMKSECESLRRTSEKAVNNLFETLKANEVMNACGDDYIDKVEEKNQELLVGAKKLRTKICELPTTETPSEWTKQLSKVVCELFEDNSSIICKLLKYYAMSNVPCMIDNKREEGLCFIRKNISKAYSSLTILLSQCGITPIIPAIFVENIHENEYEVEGNFNDIESFCPGSINEHIEHIERDSDGLDGIIVGVTKVGFKSADGKLVKTQVIIK